MTEFEHTNDLCENLSTHIMYVRNWAHNF